MLSFPHIKMHMTIDEPYDQRVPLLFKKTELERLDRFMKHHKIRSRAKAIRYLMEESLDFFDATDGMSPREAIDVITEGGKRPKKR